MGRVEDKVALITGAAGGLGAAQARVFAREGARLVLSDLSTADVEALADELAGQTLGLGHDVTDAERWNDVVTEAEAAFGRLDVLVHNAGVVSSAPLEDVGESDYRRVVDVNQTGTFLGLQAVVPAMRHAGGGSIVLMSSLAGLTGMPQTIAYGASKWAVRGMAKIAAAELGQHGIRVNSVHPGTIQTAMVSDQKQLIDTLMPQLAIPRIGEPDEVALPGQRRIQLLDRLRVRARRRLAARLIESVDQPTRAGRR